MPTAIEAQHEQSTDLVVRAKTLVISTQEDYESAAALGRDLRSVRAQIETYWNGSDETPGPVKKAYDAWKSLTTKRAEMLDPIDKALSSLDKSVLAYSAEQRRMAAEAQRIADEKARADREAQIAADLESAKAAGASKPELKAMQRAAEALPVQAPQVAAPPKPAGLSIPERWKCRLATAPGSLDALIIEAGRLLSSKKQSDVQHGRALRSFLAFNESGGNTMAKAWKNTVQVPGVEFFDDSKPRYGGKR